ncbi:uncharacterized protein CMC5_037210 [Chondromyces crocatus]|uniref:Uncharacterized protein n=1 Tax=Chondromyces crocatus TaxID=52 RepID=A0A0K1EFX3_CHOCO|nr:uncharacterized protein CMC5_037210 [Chondromyces crocatus]
MDVALGAVDAGILLGRCGGSNRHAEALRDPLAGTSRPSFERVHTLLQEPRYPPAGTSRPSSERVHTLLQEPRHPPAGTSTPSCRNLQTFFREAPHPPAGTSTPSCRNLDTLLQEPRHPPAGTSRPSCRNLQTFFREAPHPPAGTSTPSCRNLQTLLQEPPDPPAGTSRPSSERLHTLWQRPLDPPPKRPRPHPSASHQAWNEPSEASGRWGHGGSRWRTPSPACGKRTREPLAGDQIQPWANLRPGQDLDMPPGSPERAKARQDERSKPHLGPIPTTACRPRRLVDTPFAQDRHDPLARRLHYTPRLCLLSAHATDPVCRDDRYRTPPGPQ